jgi:hypothetical protein
MHMYTAACWSVQWLDKKGLPWDFKEIRRKHWKQLDEGRQTTVAHLMAVFGSTTQARGCLVQRDLERTACLMYQAGSSLGLAGVYQDPSRKLASSKYKSQTRRKHKLILRIYDEVSSAQSGLSEKEKHIQTMARVPEKMQMSLSRLRALRRERDAQS